MTNNIFVKPLLIVFVLHFLAVTAYSDNQEQSKMNWIIDARGNVGGITRASTKSDLARIFGSKNIESYDIHVGEGMFVKGTRIFGNTKNAVLIEWNDKSGTPLRIIIDGEGTDWKTSEGVTIGTTLEELEKINGGPFQIFGFGWDYEGRTVSWENGKLPSELQLDMTSTKKVSPEEERQVLGDGFFSSDHPVMKKKGLKVGTIYIRW